MPQCTWPMEYEADFVRMYLGPTFEKNGVKTKIWIVDHNYNLWGRAMGELETPNVRKYTNAIAWHGYVGKPEWMMRVQEAYPDVEMYWTEGGPDYTQPDYLTDWAKWGATFVEILRNGCRSITGWNLALDEHGKPTGDVVAKYTGLHSLRHFFVSWCLARPPIGQGLSLKEASEQAGHSSIQITADTYGHLLPRDDRAELAAAEGKFG